MDTLIRIQALADIDFNDEEREVLLVAGDTNFGIQFGAEFLDAAYVQIGNRHYERTGFTIDSLQLMQQTVAACLSNGVYHDIEQTDPSYSNGDLVKPAEQLNQDLLELKDDIDEYQPAEP